MNDKIVIKTLPNKIPAEDELKRFSPLSKHSVTAANEMAAS